jgi:hypothetical protein
MARKPDPKSKAGYVRSLPATMPAAEVVTAAKAKGIKLDVAYVYAVRGAKKKRATLARAAKPTATAGGGGEIPISLGKAKTVGGLVHEIERIIEAKVSALLKERLAGLFGG